MHLALRRHGSPTLDVPVGTIPRWLLSLCVRCVAPSSFTSFFFFRELSNASNFRIDVDLLACAPPGSQAKCRTKGLSCSRNRSFRNRTAALPWIDRADVARQGIESAVVTTAPSLPCTGSAPVARSQGCGSKHRLRYHASGLWTQAGLSNHSAHVLFLSACERNKASLKPKRLYNTGGA